MIQKYLPYSLCIFVLIACTELHFLRQTENAHSITKDAMGTRWIDLHHGTCTVRVISFHKEHLRLAVENPQNPLAVCEPGVSPLVDVAAPAAKALIRSYKSDKIANLQMDLDLSSQPTLLKKWAVFLKNNPEWQSRKISKNPWGNSEHPLVKTLIEQSDVFSSYNPLLAKFPEFTKKKLHIEKIDYVPASHFPFFESDLRPAGYVPQERIPVPLVVSIDLKK